MSDELIFEPLPPKRSARRAAWNNALRERPGEWARLPIKNNGNMQHYRDQGIEIVRRTVDGEKRFYGRFIGVNGEHA